MAETLAQKAQRLGIKPAGQPVATSTTETLAQKAQRLGIKPANQAPVEAPAKKSYQTNPNALGRAIGGVASDFFGSAVVKPAIYTAQNVAGIGLELLGTPEQKQRYKESISKPTNVPIGSATITVPPQNPDAGKQALSQAGDLLKATSYVYGGGAGKQAVGQTLKGQILSSSALGARAGGVGGAMYGSGQALQQEDASLQSVAGQGALYGTLGAVSGGVLGAGLPLIPKAVGAISETLKPEKIMQRVARLSKSKQQKFQNITGESVGDYLVNRGIYGDIDEISGQLYTRFTQSKSAADAALEQLQGTYKPPVAKTILNQLLEREQRISIEGAESTLIPRVRQLQAKFDTEGLTMTEINELKRLYERNVRVDYLRQNLPEKVQQANNIDNAVRTWQFAKAEELGLKNLPQINKETQAAKQLLDDLGKEYAGNAANNAVSLTDWIVLSGGDPTAVSAYLTKKVLSDKGIQSSIAKKFAGNAKIPAPSAQFESPYGYLPQLPAGTQPTINIPPRGRVPVGLGDEPAVIRGTLPQQQLPEKLQSQSLPPQSTTLPKKSTGVINTIKQKLDEIPNKQGGFVKLPQGKGAQVPAKGGSVSLPKNTKQTFIGEAPTGYKPAPLTTKLLKKLEGKTTVSKQFISDLTNSPDLKQVEKDLIRSKLEGKGNTINVADFGKEVEAELLPLKTNSTKVEKMTRKQAISKLEKKGIRVEEDMDGSANLVDKNDDYLEYDSLDAETRKLADTAMGDADNYTDMISGSAKYESITLPSEQRGKVTDYFENIYESPIKTSAGNTHFGTKTDSYFGHTRIEDMADNSTRRVIEVQSDLFQKGNLEREGSEAAAREKIGGISGRGSHPDDAKRVAEVAKLAQYNNPTAHFRMVREEIQKASKDGKTKLQFPTGETAMKIEGLGTNNNWRIVRDGNPTGLNPNDLKVGQEIFDSNVGQADWIITDVLGDGKFKAVPKSVADKIDITGPRTSTLASAEETFDISGKVDTNNPIYKFYDKELQKYLKNNFNAQQVTDKQGVSWFEVPVTKEYKNMPIEAFGIIGALGGASLMSNE